MQYRKKVIQTILPYTNGVRKYFILLAVCTGLSMILTFITPLFYRLFIDEVILNNHFSMMNSVVSGYLAIFAAGALIGYLKKHAEYAFIHKVLYRIKDSIFSGYLNLDFNEYAHTELGDMKLKLDDDTALIREYTSTQTIEYGVSFITMLVCGFILLTTDLRLALFSMAAIPATFLLDDLVSSCEKRINHVKRENAQKMTSWLQSSLQGWREVRALNLYHSQLKSFVKYLHVGAKCNAKWINCWTARSLVIPKIKEEFFMRFGLYFIGGLLIAAGKLTIGDLLVFVVYYEMMSDAMKKVSAADAQLQADMPVTDRFIEQLTRSISSDTASEKSFPEKFEELRLENIAFRYPGTQTDVLENFSLSISAGDRIAITGKSGSGKSTVLKLITGMLTPSAGKIYYNGVDIRQINKEQLYRHIGFVMQENILFHMSIRENLRYGKSNATEEEMIDSCKKVCIYEFISGLPEGLDTIIGEKGLKLSGGQRQRLILARLFLRDVSIYIFDEATSALDSYSENFIQDTLQSLTKDKTLIVVAHRESSIRVCNRIIQI